MVLERVIACCAPSFRDEWLASRGSTSVVEKASSRFCSSSACCFNFERSTAHFRPASLRSASASRNLRPASLSRLLYSSSIISIFSSSALRVLDSAAAAAFAAAGGNNEELGLNLYSAGIPSCACALMSSL